MSKSPPFSDRGLDDQRDHVGEISPFRNGLADRSRSGNGLANGDSERLARALGWFSLALGLVQVAAPGRVAQMVGVADDAEAQTVMRAVGLREIASGVGILTQAKPTPWLWARVGGDAMDLALLMRAKGSPGVDQRRVTAATAAVIGIAAVDTVCSVRLGTEPEVAVEPARQRGDVPVKAAITVNAPSELVYEAWENFQNLPRFMGDFATVEITGDRQSHWRTALPGGIDVDWDVEIIDATPNERIGWRTAEGGGVVVAGDVRFRAAPGERGTEVLFDAQFSPPGGDIGRRIGEVFADSLGRKIQNDLRRFKQLMEIGEIVLSDDSITKGPNPARPPERPIAI